MDIIGRALHPRIVGLLHDYNSIDQPTEYDLDFGYGVENESEDEDEYASDGEDEDARVEPAMKRKSELAPPLDYSFAQMEDIVARHQRGHSFEAIQHQYPKLHHRTQLTRCVECAYWQ
jgi:hypothetical protein